VFDGEQGVEMGAHDVVAGAGRVVCVYRDARRCCEQLAVRVQSSYGTVLKYSRREDVRERGGVGDWRGDEGTSVEDRCRC